MIETQTQIQLTAITESSFVCPIDGEGFSALGELQLHIVDAHSTLPLANAMNTTNSILVGSSDGSANQGFTLTDIPIITIEIWVNELDTLLEREIENLANKADLEVERILDRQGNTIEFWVKWQETANLLMSSANARHYEVDEDSGTVRFGDGQHGTRLPAGKNNIKASYSLSAGTTGY
jgi:hypothetical protein